MACPFIKAIAPWPVSAMAPCPIATLSVDLAVPCIETELDPDAVPETKAILFAPEANVPFTPWANELTPPAVASPPECEFFPFA